MSIGNVPYSYTQYSKLGYRPSVGLMIINSKKEILVAKRTEKHADIVWQMPQGGIDLGETPSRAALREMQEEIGCNLGTIIAESKNWYCYDLPKRVVVKMWNGRYRGQRQKWFLIRFTGQDSDINLETANPEFVDWKWSSAEQLLDVVSPYKIPLYEAVLNEFRTHLASENS